MTPEQACPERDPGWIPAFAKKIMRQARPLGVLPQHIPGQACKYLPDRHNFSKVTFELPV
jgi:hypothetical protein